MRRDIRSALSPIFTLGMVASAALAQTGPIQCGGATIGFIDDFETLAPLPTPLNNQFTVIGQDWSNAWLSVPSFPERAAIVDNAGSPVGGNGSQTLRGRVTNIPTGGPSPSLGARARFPEAIVPPADGFVRYETDTFVESLQSGWTWDVGEAPLARVAWGGFDLGNGSLVSTFLVATASGFVQARYVGSAPAGANVGDVVPTPLNDWFRLSIEHDADADTRVFIDFLDGQGRFLIHEGEALFQPSATGIAWRFMSYLETLGATVHFDRLRVRALSPGCGDLNGDDAINFGDLNIMLGAFNGPAGDCPGPDLNLDDAVNFADLNVLLGRFNTACE